MATKVQSGKIKAFFLVIGLSLAALLSLLYLSTFKPDATPTIPASTHQISSLERARSDYEKQVASSIQTLLFTWLGQNTAEVSVRAEIDFTQNQRTQEILDIDNPALQSANGDDVQYTYSKQTLQSNQQAGIVKKLSIAVLLDSQKNQFTDAKLTDIRRLIERSAGFNEARGDTLEIIETPFASTPFFSNAVWAPSLVVFLIIFLFVLFGVLILKNGEVAAAIEPAPAVLPAFTRPEVVGTVGMNNQIDGEITPNALKKAQTLLSKKPDETLTVLRGWLCQTEGGVHES